MREKCYFITSTGTEIGKTYISSLLIRNLISRNKEVLALKPILTGFNKKDIANNDSAELLSAMSKKVSYTEIKNISPWLFSEPLSPYHAAQIEKRYLNIDNVVTWCNEKIKVANDYKFYLLIEGIGGVMVPLNKESTVLDLITSLNIPIILIVGTYLGSISHTLSAVSNLLNKGLELKSIIINESFNDNIGLKMTEQAIKDFVPNINVRLCKRNTNFDDKLTDLLINDIL